MNILSKSNSCNPGNSSSVQIFSCLLTMSEIQTCPFIAFFPTLISSFVVFPMAEHTTAGIFPLFISFLIILDILLILSGDPMEVPPNLKTVTGSMNPLTIGNKINERKKNMI